MGTEVIAGNYTKFTMDGTGTVKVNGSLTFTNTVSGTMDISGNSSMDASLSATGASTTVTLHDMTANGATGFNGTLTLTSNANVVNILQDAIVSVAGVMTIDGITSNEVTVDIQRTAIDTDYIFRGQVNFGGTNAAGAANSIDIKSGCLDNGDTALVVGADAGGSVDISVSGGSTRYIDTNAGVGNYYFTGGNVYNIRDENKAAADKTDLTVASSAVYNGGSYNANSILNMGDSTAGTGGIQVGGGTAGTTNLTIGAITPNDWTDYYYKAIDLTGSANFITGQQAQLTATNVVVGGATDKNSKLTIHENFANWGLDELTVNTNNRNIVDTMQIYGQVTIDRTTVQSDKAGGTQVTVMQEGVLRGFGQFADGALPHTPIRANVIGDVLLSAGNPAADVKGATLQPYDKTLFSHSGTENNWQNVKNLMGVVFQVDGDTEFQQASILSTRLFAYDDGNPLNPINETPVTTGNWSDALYTNSATFSTIWTNTSERDNSITDKTAQKYKAQYNPVFGFDYEITSKKDFTVYKGDGSATDTTYWFKVVQSATEIEGLYQKNDTTGTLMADANHLFNRLILKSDMLGEWYFTYNDNHDEIILRFRLLAEHPVNGGLVVNETERNNILPGKYLDEIRYPFETSYQHNLPNEYPGDLPLGSDNSNFYGDTGYNGDLVAWYENPLTRPAAADNYKKAWMEDWAELLQGFQLELQNATYGMSRGLRMLHAESYANLSESNFNVMSQFIRNRERNAVSALFQVESNNGEEAVDWDRTDSDLEERYGDFFVRNPMRFWASGFGADGRHRKSGSEYGYNTEIWGGAVGAVKEIRDQYYGLTLGYSRARNTWNDLPSAGTTNSYLVEALFGTRIFNWGFLELHANYSYGQQKMNRTINLGGGYYTGWAKGEFNDHLFGGGVRVGYQKMLGGWLLLPTLGVQAMHYRNGSFTERGRQNMANIMQFEDGSMNRSLLRTPLVVRVSRSFAVSGFVLTPEVRGGVTTLLGPRRGKARAQWVGNPFSGRYFTSYGAKRDWYELEAGATVELSRRGRFYVAGNYDYSYSSKSHMHSFSLQTGLNF